MIDKTVIIETVLERLPKLPVGHYLDMRTYKRNRWVLFIKTAEDEYTVIQEGFERDRFENVPRARLKKLMKTLLKKEFPRSTKVRLYTMGVYDPAEFESLNRKKL